MPWMVSNTAICKCHLFWWEFPQQMQTNWITLISCHQRALWNEAWATGVSIKCTNSNFVIGLNKQKVYKPWLQCELTPIWLVIHICNEKNDILANLLILSDIIKQAQCVNIPTAIWCFGVNQLQVHKPWLWYQIINFWLYWGSYMCDAMKKRGNIQVRHVYSDATIHHLNWEYEKNSILVIFFSSFQNFHG